MNTPPFPALGDAEPLLEWEGPAINSPATANAKEVENFLANPSRIADAAIWVDFCIACAVLGISMDSSRREARKAKADSFLKAWHRQYGPEKLAELKQHVIAHITTHRVDPQKTEAVLRAAEEFFARAGE
jgi:hypothetical protein